MPSKQKKQQKTDRYLNWLTTQLDRAQLRAFAAQCGLSEWRDAELSTLKKQLANNQTGRSIFAKTFGNTEVGRG